MSSTHEQVPGRTECLPGKKTYCWRETHELVPRKTGCFAEKKIHCWRKTHESLHVLKSKWNKKNLSHRLTIKNKGTHEI